MKNNSNTIPIVIGVMFIFMGIIVGRNGLNMILNGYRFQSKAIAVESIVTDIQLERYGSGNETRTRRIANIEYVIDGIKYDSNVNHKSGMLIGDKITLYYLPDEPWILKYNTMNEAEWDNFCLAEAEKASFGLGSGIA